MEWWIIVIIVVAVLWIILMYNAFVRVSNQVKNAWAQIDVQLKRRTDLIPNLIESVKGYMKHEKTVLEEVTKARTALMGAQTPTENAKADNMLTGALKSLFAVSENYPDLKANTNFIQLQEELVSTENKVAYSRQHYNDMVMKYNTKLQSFPNNLFSGVFGFSKADSFEAEATDRKPVKVSF
ncbi:MAG: LemA family protein [Candidatus Woesearchaeota archaeon]